MASAPFSLIESEVPISGGRLSDWLHRKAHRGRSGRRSLRNTAWKRPIARPAWSLAEVAAALQAMRGIDLIAAGQPT